MDHYTFPITTSTHTTHLHLPALPGTTWREEERQAISPLGEQNLMYIILYMEVKKEGTGGPHSVVTALAHCATYPGGLPHTWTSLPYHTAHTHLHHHHLPHLTPHTHCQTSAYPLAVLLGDGLGGPHLDEEQTLPTLKQDQAVADPQEEDDMV